MAEIVMHESAYFDAQRFRDKYLNPDQVVKIADIGSYDVNGCLRPLFDSENWSYTGMDLSAGPNVDVVLPIEYGWSIQHQESFDVVVTTQVMEHVRRPWEWVKDVSGICKPGGLIYVCTPNTIGFHEFPIDCWRAWPDGLRALVEDYAEVLECYVSDINTTAICRRRQ